MWWLVLPETIVEIQYSSCLPAPHSGLVAPYHLALHSSRVRPCLFCGYSVGYFESHELHGLQFDHSLLIPIQVGHHLFFGPAPDTCGSTAAFSQPFVIETPAVACLVISQGQAVCFPIFLIVDIDSRVLSFVPNISRYDISLMYSTWIIVP